MPMQMLVSRGLFGAYDLASLLQARVVFALTALAGLRTTFFQYWRWRDVELVKVPMLRGQVREATEEVVHDDDTLVSTDVLVEAVAE